MFVLSKAIIDGIAQSQGYISTCQKQLLLFVDFLGMRSICENKKTHLTTLNYGHMLCYIIGIHPYL